MTVNARSILICRIIAILPSKRVRISLLENGPNPFYVGRLFALVRMTMTISGECFCGSITYEITGKLRDARSCHCSRCRKAFSSQASSYAEVNAEEFRWLAGKELLTTYNSKQGFGLQFCSRCGSTLCGVYQGDVHGVTLGCINGDPDIEIGRHIYVGSKASWEVIPEGVVLFNGESPPSSDV